LREQVILVDPADRETGTLEKLEAHQKGLLHRAVSVILFNSQGEMLLQKRADGKYHSAGLWTNACCSHPRPGESPPAAARRRLKEEMGLSADLAFAFSFSYTARVGELIENEFDHVFTGLSDEFPVPDPSEVSEWKYMAEAGLTDLITRHPYSFTAWFRILMADPRTLQLAGWRRS
jgi:isopentenyl-diphosphate delta-isomerase